MAAAVQLNSRETSLRPIWPALLDMIHGILCDLAGVLHIDDDLCPGAAQALAGVREAGLPVRFVTNTTRKTQAQLMARLHGLGLEIDATEVFTAPLAARAYCRAKNLHPYLLIHPGLEPDLIELEAATPNSVLVADAGEGFSYANLNKAFRVLMRGGPLIAVAKNRYFRDGEALSLDAGPFVVALEYACEVKAKLIGKPARDFFLTAVQDMGLPAADVVMIGDDVEADVCGAIDAGLTGILVRTGKYREGDETRLPENAHLAADVGEAVEMVLEGTLTGKE